MTEVITPVVAASGDTPAKLTEWKNEPSVKDLVADYEASRPAHDIHQSDVTRWTNLLEVKGDQKPKKIQGRSSVQPKLIRRQNEWRYSALTEPFLGSDKLYEVKPVTYEDKDGAEQNELVLNSQFRTKIDRVNFIDEYIRTTVDEGTCILRTGWIRETKMVKETVPVFSYYPLMDGSPELESLERAIQIKAENPRMYEENASDALKAAVDYFEETQTPTIAIQVGTQEVEVEKVIKNHPTVDILNPANVYIDPSCGKDFTKAMFVVVLFETSYSELKKTGLYKNLDQIPFDAAGPVDSEFYQPDSVDASYQFKDKARRKIVAQEYWGYYDVEGDGVLVPIVATWIGNTMIRLEENPYPDKKLPFVLVPYLPRKRSIFGETDAELLEDNQKILGALTRGAIDLLGRSANGQQGFMKGMLDVPNKRKFDQGMNYEFNPVVQDISKGYVEHKYPELPRSVMEMTMMVNQEAEALSGVKSFAGGMSGESYGQVAAGIRGVLDAASKREMAILRRLSAGLVEVGKKFIAMNAVFLSEKEVVRLTNEEFVEVYRDELAGEYDLIVDISTAEVDNAQAQDLGFMLQTMGPNMDFEMTKMILADIARLKRLPTLAKQIKNFTPEPDPVEEMKKQLEVEELQAKIEETRARAALARAKAREAESSADKKDLDYINDADGVTHSREMDKQRGQAEGNQDLEVTKALGKPKKEGEGEPDVAAMVGWNEISKNRPRESQPTVDNFSARDALAVDDPTYSLGSSYFDPTQDPALNLGRNL